MIRLFLLSAVNEIPVERWIWPALGIVGLLFAAAILVSLFRRRIRHEQTLPPAGFTLSDLRQLVREGKMTQDEYDRAKNRVLEATRRAEKIKTASETLSQKPIADQDRSDDP